MKIRTALVLACFLLSALPLGGIVVYSYFSSRRALQSVYHAQAARLTAEMDQRLGDIRGVLQQRLAEVSAIPDLPRAGEQPDTVLMTIGDLAPLVHSLEIQPSAPDPPKRVVIPVPPMPKMPRATISEAQRAQLRKISELGNQLGKRWNLMTPEERTKVQQQINEA